MANHMNDIPNAHRWPINLPVPADLTAWAISLLHRTDFPIGAMATRGNVIARAEIHTNRDPNGARGISLWVSDQNASGIDVSSYQGTADWAAIRATGKSFVFIRASEGITIEDSMCANHHVGSGNAGLLRGFYHYFEPGDDPSAQVSNFLSAVSKAELSGGCCELAPVVDVETLRNLDPSTVANNVLAFVRGIEASFGAKPLIYTSPSFWDSLPYVGLEDICDLWVAHWGVASPTIPGRWTSWRFWQQTSTGRVNGDPGNADVSIFIGWEALLRA